MNKKIGTKIFAICFAVILLLFFNLITGKSKKDVIQNEKTNISAKERVKTDITPFLREMHITPKVTTIAPGKKFNFTISRDVTFSGNLSNVKISFKIPESIPNKQIISNIEIHPSPEKITKDIDGEFAYIKIASPPKKMTITVNGDAIIYPYNLQTAEVVNKNTDGILSDEDRVLYLSNEDNINVNSRFLKKVASKEINTATNDVDTVKNIYDYVVEHLKYNPSDTGKDKGAYEALISGTGVCEEFSDLFVTLCRLKKIPARIREGFTIPFEDEIQDKYAGHSWAEVYFDDYGWVEIDPTNKIPEKIMAKVQSFSILPYDFISQVIKNRLYLITDMNQIYVEYEGNGNISSSNLMIKY